MAKRKSQQSREIPIVELIVRRGALRRFNALKRSTSDLPVKLSWDRRQSERRAASADVNSDHRQQERRKDPPFTWEAADFLAVEIAPPENADRD